MAWRNLSSRMAAIVGMGSRSENREARSEKRPEIKRQKKTGRRPDYYEVADGSGKAWVSPPRAVVNGAGWEGYDAEGEWRVNKVGVNTSK